MKTRQVGNVYSAISAIMSGESAMSVQSRTRIGSIFMDWYYVMSGALAMAQHAQIEQSTLEQLQAYGEWIELKTNSCAV